jgi:hypothetical protein
MTRRLRPSVPLVVACDESGVPRSVRHAGHTLHVTHVAACWRQRPHWWREGAAAKAPETEHYRLVLDRHVVFEVHWEERRWWLDRIFD